MNTTWIAYDPGYGNIKLVADGTMVVMQSAVSSGGQARLSGIEGLRTQRHAMRIDSDGGVFHVGPHAHDIGRPIESLDFDRLSGSPEMMALFYGALSRGALADQHVNLLVGLPIHVLMGEGAEETKQQVRQSLRGHHAWQANDASHWLTIHDVRITSQPVGAMFDYLLDDSGRMLASRQKAFEGEIGILGIGMNTMDLLVVRNGSPVERFTGGDTLGVRRMLELAGEGNGYTIFELDDSLRAGRLDQAKAQKVWQSEVIGFIERQWGSTFGRFSAVVAVGGGSLILRYPLMRRFRDKMHVPDNPILATARGLFKYTQMIGRR